ncbi:MAG: glycosyltransferase [Lachnospiraceae bacterium]|nr:glycosyltransferase [Lachnospiraceae bacterium]
MENIQKKEKKFVSLVVYLYDASSFLKYFLDMIIPVCEKNFEQFELVCVDDGCRDGTVELLKEYVEKRQIGAMVNVVHMSFFQGLESAMNAGRDIAIGDFVYEFDDIFVDYEPEVIMEVYRRLLEGNDIVAASSRGKLRFTSRVFYALYNKTSKGNEKIGPETFRLVSRRAINRIKSMGQYIPYRKAVYMNCGLKASTIHYDSRDVNVRIKNKTVVAERTSLALDSFIYFTNVLERISAIICGLFLIFTVGMGFYLVLNIFNSTKPVEGWLSTMGFLALGFFGVFALLTIILKYLSVLLNLIFRHQRYLVSDIEKVVKR